MNSIQTMSMTGETMREESKQQVWTREYLEDIKKQYEARDKLYKTITTDKAEQHYKKLVPFIDLIRNNGRWDGHRLIREVEGWTFVLLKVACYTLQESKNEYAVMMTSSWCTQTISFLVDDERGLILPTAILDMFGGETYVSDSPESIDEGIMWLAENALELALYGFEKTSDFKRE